jgi:hypothetical protein
MFSVVLICISMHIKCRRVKARLGHRIYEG